jgi:hypothetical protein
VSEGSALFEHCKVIYNAMLDRADDESTREQPTLIYRGSLSQLFNEVGVGQPYYSQVMNKLKSMDCARLIRRGARDVPSEWLLLQEPTTELFKLPDTVTPSRQGSAAQRAQRQRDLNERITRIEQYLRSQGANL